MFVINGSEFQLMISRFLLPEVKQVVQHAGAHHVTRGCPFVSVVRSELVRPARMRSARPVRTKRARETSQWP